MAATLPNWSRVYGNYGKRWDGGVASIMPFEGESVLGSIVYLSKEEMYMLDVFEGAKRSDPLSSDPKINMYRREEVPTFVRGKDGKLTQLNSIAYIMNDTKWVK